MVQVKICGLTNEKQALECVRLGANAIGCVFYPKSPRNLSEEQAKEICRALPSEIVSVGVFVNETFSNIIKKVEYCGLKGVQLHGQESPQLVRQLRDEHLLVIKGLYVEGKPSLNEAASFDASAYLVECGKGPLPGGNALSWNWQTAKSFGEHYPFILAGGLTPDNVFHAVTASMPDAVDVSSGVESAPGQKDLIKVEVFMDALSQCKFNRKVRRIF